MFYWENLKCKILSPARVPGCATFASMNTTRLVTRTLQARSFRRASHRFNSNIAATKTVNSPRKMLSCLLFSILSFGTLIQNALNGADNTARLQDEILAVEPKAVWETISKNQGEGCNIYVLDDGKLHNNLKSKCITYEEKSGEDLPQTESHGNAVLSVIKAEKGLAKNAKVHYYETPGAVDFTAAMARTAIMAEAPGVVTCSVLAKPQNLFSDAFLSVITCIAISVLNAKGIPVICAAGNDGSDEAPTALPATCKGVWTVGNVEKISLGMLTNFWGVYPTSNYGDWVNYYAPGTRKVQIYNELEDKAPAYETKTGTSYAAPSVAATSALLMTAYPWMRKDDLQVALNHISVDGKDPNGRIIKRIPTELIRHLE